MPFHSHKIAQQTLSFTVCTEGERLAKKPHLESAKAGDKELMGRLFCSPLV